MTAADTSCGKTALVCCWQSTDVQGWVREVCSATSSSLSSTTDLRSDLCHVWTRQSRGHVLPRQAARPEPAGQPASILLSAIEEFLEVRGQGIWDETGQ